MFNTGDYVFYGANGVCVVAGVVPSPSDKNDTRLFYKLYPFNDSDKSTMYTPVDNPLLRALLSREDICCLIKNMPQTEEVRVDNEKHRKDAYRTALSRNMPTGCVSVIKSIYNRKKILEDKRKKLSDTEAKFEVLAKRYLHEEIAAVLGLREQDVEGYILKCLNITQ